MIRIRSALMMLGVVLLLGFAAGQFAGPVPVGAGDCPNQICYMYESDDDDITWHYECNAGGGDSWCEWHDFDPYHPMCSTEDCASVPPCQTPDCGGEPIPDGGNPDT